MRQNHEKMCIDFVIHLLNLLDPVLSNQSGLGASPPLRYSNSVWPTYMEINQMIKEDFGIDNGFTRENGEGIHLSFRYACSGSG